MMKANLDKSEQRVLNSFERGEWTPVRDQQNALAKHRRLARNTLHKDRRVNIRISAKDLEGIQARAVEDGVPYQTLMASVLHRYVSGALVFTSNRSGRSPAQR
jgi:predicted DNA binding CopG/RHH family protein